MQVKPVKLVWITPDAERRLVEIARVSNPKNQETGGNEARLISYMIRNQHWSPFEMVSACLEINTTRDIARQILRHRSFSFQEFSGRYQRFDALPEASYREARLQDSANRQNSIETDDATLEAAWRNEQAAVLRAAQKAYSWALNAGIAKEVARAVLPEGLTPSRLYMTGTIRSWLHYLAVRTDAGVQKEHRLIAAEADTILRVEMPTVFGVASETLK